MYTFAVKQLHTVQSITDYFFFGTHPSCVQDQTEVFFSVKDIALAIHQIY